MLNLLIILPCMQEIFTKMHKTSVGKANGHGKGPWAHMVMSASAMWCRLTPPWPAMSLIHVKG